MATTITETRIRFPKDKLNKNWVFERDQNGQLTEEPILTLQFNNLYSPDVTVIRPYLIVYGVGGTEICTIAGTNFVADTVRKNHDVTFTFPYDPDKNIDRDDECYSIQIELYFNNDYEVRFNKLILSKGGHTEYREPTSELPAQTINFKNNFYCLLYPKNNEGYLQVIRPLYDSITTKELTKSDVSVLIPHLPSEDIVDRYDKVGLEYMYSTDQTIDIKL